MYDRIPKAETGQLYLEVALTRGRTAASRVKKISDALILAKAKERDRVRAVRDSLVTSLKKLHDAYPSFDHMGEFTRRVFALDLEPGRVKQALGGLQHAITTIRGLAREYVHQLGKAHSHEAVTRASRAYFGRIASVLKQTEKHFRLLNEARTVFRNLPTVDDELFTVAIAGFPNVGKSTLLRKLTTARPEVKPYAFTTKGLNVGYFSHAYNKIQCIDTPGSLHRAQMNAIEKKADIALRYLAHLVVFVVDPTESYPIEKQRALLVNVKKLKKPVLVYVSKTDLVDATEVLQVFPGSFSSPSLLKKALIAAFRKWV